MAGASSSTGIVTYQRVHPPNDYCFTVKSFSLLSQTEVEKYETDSFEAGGYRWRLTLYPKGDKRNNGSGYISLYLAIDNPSSLRRGWEVNASFRLFVRDQLRKTYLTFEGGADPDRIKRYHADRTERGFPRLISLKEFNDATKGYLVGDTCVFGAEVFVVKPTRKLESLTMTKVPSRNTYKWTIEGFSKLGKKLHCSPTFSIGEHKWRLKINPKGSTNEVSIFLELDGAGDLPSKRKVYGDYVLRVRDQLNANHKDIKTSHWFSRSCTSYGFPRFVSLDDLSNPANGYLRKDRLIVEVEILVVSSAVTSYK